MQDHQDFEISLRILGNEVIAFTFNGGLASKTFNRGMIVLLVLLSVSIFFGEDLMKLVR